VLVFCLAAGSHALATDRRAYQHGIRLVKDQTAAIWAIWSSSPGNPPEGQKKLVLSDGTRCGYFTHNIFYSHINPEHPVIQPQLLLEMPEAQEPVDAAVNDDGTIAITFEDGSDSDTKTCDGVIAQRYQIFTHFPDEASELLTVSIDGAHSGHIASVGNKFVIVHAEGWIDGEGAFDGGTANDIYVETISRQGVSRHYRAVARDKGSNRDWWPLIAGSSNNALLVWQRLVDGSSYAQMMIAVYNPKQNVLTKPVTVLKENLQYYHFDVQYLAEIDRFLVLGNFLGKTITPNSLSVVSPKLFALLLDTSGDIVDVWESDSSCAHCSSYPALNLVREVRPAISNKDGMANVLYPVKPDGIAWFKISKQSIRLNQVLRQERQWFPLGTDGIFLDDRRVLFVNLSQTGVKTVELSLP